MGIQAQTRPVRLATTPAGAISGLLPATVGTEEDVAREDHSHDLAHIGLVAAVATSNVVTNGPETVDGYALSDTELVLLAGQTDPAEIGVWQVDTAGAWAQLSFERGALAFVLNGDEHAGSYWIAVGNTGSATVHKFWQHNSPLFTPYTNHGNTTGAVTIESRDGAVQRFVLTGNLTVTLDAAVAPGKAQTITLLFVQDGTGSRTITWPGSVNWEAATAPTLSTAASSEDMVTLITFDGGTSWYGFLVGVGMA